MYLTPQTTRMVFSSDYSPLGDQGKMARQVYLLTLHLTQFQQSLEKRLETHDIALPLPDPNQPSRQQFLRLILLSATDLSTNSTATMSRIERLQLQGDDKNVGVVFLICEKNNENKSGNGSMAFVNLQLKYIPKPTSFSFNIKKAYRKTKLASKTPPSSHYTPSRA